MHFLAVVAAASGLLLVFLSRETLRFRLVSGWSSLFSAAYIYGMAESLNFVESLGMFGFSLWLGSLLLLAGSLIGEVSTTGEHKKSAAIASISVSLISNAVFAFLFARAAGLGIV